MLSISLQDLVLLRLSWWIQGWGDPFPYNSNEILRNPQCLNWELNHSSQSISHSIHPPLMWSPPPPNNYKWNVDASMKICDSKAAIGGVLRNHEGKFICLFSSSIPFMDINHAEILAIQRAIKISSSLEYCYHSQLIVESDSANAVKWCNGVTKEPWNINFIKNAMDANHGIKVIHKGRESNEVADYLAKKGLTRHDEFIAWL